MKMFVNFKMIFFVFLTVTPQFYAMIRDLRHVNIIITKINVDLFTVKKGAFLGINQIIHAELCRDLENAPVIPFEPLPISSEYFVVLHKNESSSRPQNISSSSQSENTLTSSYPQDIESSSQSQNTPNSSQPKDIGSSSQSQSSLQAQDIESLSQPQDSTRSSQPQDTTSSLQSQNTSKYLELTKFFNFLQPSQQKRKVVHYINFGQNKQKVSALPCKFKDFLLYLVPAAEFYGYFLFLEGEDPLMTLGITLKQQFFTLIDDDSYEKLWVIKQLVKIKKDPKLFTPMKDNTDETEKKKLQNLKICASFFSYYEIIFYNKEKLLTATMTYQEDEKMDSLMCHFASFLTFEIYEHPTKNLRVFVSHQVLLTPFKHEYYKITLQGSDNPNL